MAAKKGNNYAEGQGRPTKYDSVFDKRVFKLALLGLTDIEISELLGVAESTFNEWKIEHPSFSESLNKGKTGADANVASSLYKRAKGYKYESEKIFQFQGSAVKIPYTEVVLPDVGAAKLWLSNRQRTRWRDSIDVTTKGEKIESKLSLDSLSLDVLEKLYEVKQAIEKEKE